MFLFLIAAGLSLIFGVLRVLNFAHGTFYMLGAYATYQLVQWMGVSGGRFWLTPLGGALGVNVDALYTWVFVLASFLGGLGGALISPMRATTPGMDTEVIVEAFVVVVIGGLGSFWGTFLGALIYGQVLSFGILFFPRFSIFAVFALMAAVLIVRPWGLLGRPLR